MQGGEYHRRRQRAVGSGVVEPSGERAQEEGVGDWM